MLTVPDCPNAPLALERITAALDGREADVELVEVRDEAEAARWGMTGSPTVLLDGTDPFAVPGAPVSASCRLYPDEEGRAAGAPGVEALRKTLARAKECCDDDLLDPIGRAGRVRRAPAERGLRAVHQTVLRHFATTGSAPSTVDLEAVAAPLEGRREHAPLRSRSTSKPTDALPAPAPTPPAAAATGSAPSTRPASNAPVPVCRSSSITRPSARPGPWQRSAGPAPGTIPHITILATAKPRPTPAAPSSEQPTERAAVPSGFSSPEAAPDPSPGRRRPYRQRRSWG